MLQILKQIVLRIVLGNTLSNEKYKIKESSFYQDQLTKRRKVYSVVQAVNGEMYEGLLSWFQGIIRVFMIVITILGISLMVARFICGYSFDSYLFLVIFFVVLVWGIAILCDIAYQYFAKTFWVFTKEGIIHSNVWGKVRHISYEEIKETIDKKKVIVRKGCIYIPYKGGKMPLQMYLDRTDYRAIPILNRECGIQLPDMSDFKTREIVRRGGMGTGWMQIGILIFICFYVFFEVAGIIENTQFSLYYGWDFRLHAMMDLWLIGIGFIMRILFYYPTWKYFRPYKNVKVR